MLMKWKEEMSTGNYDIDCRHEELFSKVKLLMDSANNRAGKEYLGKFLWFLQRYIRKHFQAEECLLRSLGYCGYKEHKEQHDLFCEKVRKIEEQHAREGESTLLIVAVIQMLSDWLKVHVNIYDREVSMFLREKGV